MIFVRPYLEGTQFTIRADLDLICLIMKLSTATGLLQSLRLRLMEYDLEV